MLLANKATSLSIHISHSLNITSANLLTTTTTLMKNQNFVLVGTEANYCHGCKKVTGLIELALPEADTGIAHFLDGPDAGTPAVGVTGVSLHLDEAALVELIQNLQQLRVDLKKEERFAELAGVSK